jgi:hypothetical protein
MKAWHREVREEIRLAKEAAHQAELAFVKEQHDAKLRYSLMKMREGDQVFVNTMCIRSWCDYVAEARLAKKTGDHLGMAEQVARLKRIHDTSTEKMLAQWAAHNGEANIKITFGSWKAHSAAEAQLKHHGNAMNDTTDAHHELVDRTLRMLSGKSDAAVSLHIIVHSWRQDIERDKRMDFEAAKLAANAEAEKQRIAQMRFCLGKLDDHSEAF